jgi:hypothetical protein
VYYDLVLFDETTPLTDKLRLVNQGKCWKQYLASIVPDIFKSLDMMLEEMEL